MNLHLSQKKIWWKMHGFSKDKTRMAVNGVWGGYTSLAIGEI